MSSNPLKRKSTITDFFVASKTTRSKTTNTKRTSERQSAQFLKRNSQLPSNCSAFYKGYSSKSTIPRGIKQSKWSRRYGAIPNNSKYNQFLPSMASGSASTGLGHIKAAQDLAPKTEESTCYYETRTVIPKAGDTMIPPSFERSKLLVTMYKEKEWPTWTFCASAMDFTNIGNHYTINMGY
jgi:hypothetical protein